MERPNTTSPALSALASQPVDVSIHKSDADIATPGGYSIVDASTTPADAVVTVPAGRARNRYATAIPSACQRWPQCPPRNLGVNLAPG